ncbi:MAG TPA: DUF192 domain-containing protein [Candidatus Limnocylindrales bacterium]|jgi:uncharacterized membrane protein (UPF0127 family)|nr:DUF192 domain-containing protein [Candidatus Limnocylindrales bacterium]
MRLNRRTVRAVNTTRGTELGTKVRVADTGLSRIVGLLGERALPEGEGLLIVPSQGVHTWGMLFPIDVLILDNDWNVLAVRRNMRSFRVTRIFWKAAAVLELPSGTAAATATAVGDTLSFDRTEVN